MINNVEILLGLTTTYQSDWRKKIQDIDKFNIDRVALFLTGIDKEDRQELYKLLEATKIRDCPHVHLRNDMDIEEVKYLINRFKIQYLNIHASNTEYAFPFEVKNKFREKIYIENNRLLNNSNIIELKEVAGLCVDFSHVEAYFLENGIDDKYLEYKNILDMFNIGCCHVSAVKKQKTKYDFNNEFGFDFHKFSDLSEFDYLKKYEKYIPKFISLELENDFEEQIKVRGYIENLL